MQENRCGEHGSQATVLWKSAERAQASLSIRVPGSLVGWKLSFKKGFEHPARTADWIPQGEAHWELTGSSLGGLTEEKLCVCLLSLSFYITPENKDYCSLLSTAQAKAGRLSLGQTQAGEQHLGQQGAYEEQDPVSEVILIPFNLFLKTLYYMVVFWRSSPVIRGLKGLYPTLL